ncbi:MAG: DinB family protein [Candidatus Eisenbacteria bacterium]|uniref:DinB family protein n=1 Tax=Eiseniibacteriota bacterium TaxID=2212470 RepID=A0A538U566_UNCEI|nr:MAG: DinB family protein [Candidatus Eisenbacteria bacterium]
MGEIRRIQEQLERSFNGESWHGPAVLEVLADVSPDQAAARPIAAAHGIGEITLHMATWKSVVARRVRGDVVDKVPDDMDWPRFEGGPAWSAALQRLRTAHQELIEALGSLREEQLDQPPYPGASTRYVQLHGAIQHDLYHAGQIAVLKKGREGVET